MPGPESIARAEAILASGKGTPEQRAKLQAMLSAMKPTAPTAETSPAAKPTAESEVIAPSAPAEKGMDIFEWSRERKIAANDRNPELRTASKRVSLAAEPYFGGKGEASKHKPFAYYEPTPEMLMQRLEAYGESLGGAKQTVVDEHIKDIRDNGKDSQYYQELADNYWRAVRSKFEKAGQPVQRVEYTGMLHKDEDIPVGTTRQRAGYAANNINSVVSPMAYGADQTSFGGVLSELAPWAFKAQGTSGDPDQQRLVKDLQADGYLPTDRESKGQEYDPVLSTIGGVGSIAAAGPLRGATLSGQALRAGAGAAGAMKGVPWLAGTTLASRLARTAAGGAVAAGVESAGRRAVQEIGKAANDEEGATAGDVASGIGSDMALGGALAGGGEALGAMPGMVGRAAGWALGKVNGGSGSAGKPVGPNGTAVTVPNNPPPAPPAAPSGGGGMSPILAALGGLAGYGAAGNPMLGAAGAMAGAVAGPMARRAVVAGAKPVLGAVARGGAMADMKMMALREAVKKVLGPNVEVPDSMLGYLGQVLGVTEAGD